MTVLRGTTSEDDFGNDEVDWSSPATTSVEHCAVQPEQGLEVIDGRQLTVTRWRLFAPHGTDLVSTDRVEYAGDVYEVDGEPQRWDGRRGYVTALLTRGAAQ